MASGAHQSKEFADRIKLIVKEAGSQAALARRLGIAQQNVSNWVNGSLPQPRVAEEVARKLGVNVRWLIAGEGRREIDGPELTEQEQLIGAIAEKLKFIHAHGGPEDVQEAEALVEAVRKRVLHRRS